MEDLVGLPNFKVLLMGGGSTEEALRRESKKNPNIAKVFEKNLKLYVTNQSTSNSFQYLGANFVTSKDKTNIGFITTYESLVQAFGKYSM